MSPQLSLSPPARQALERLAGDLARVFGPRVSAVVAYGPTRSIAFVDRVTAADLAALSPLVPHWRRDGLDTPLLTSPREFTRSLDAFPLEYQAILDRHVVIAGEPPFTEARPDQQDLRRACEVQAHAFLIHLRQGWLEAADDATEQGQLLWQAVLPFRTVLAQVAALQGEPAGDDSALAGFGAAITGHDQALLMQWFALQEHPDQALALAQRIDEVLKVAEALWAHVDGWRA